MKKVVAFILFLAFSVVISFAQENAMVWKKGKGTQKSPYLLETKEQLFYLAQQVNSGISYENSYFELANNIDLQCIPSPVWIPIGTEHTPFKGFFNGKNFTLSGLLVNNALLDYVGLFGSVYMGKIENIRIVNSSFSGNNYVGAVVGQIMGGEIYNCYNEAIVSGKENVGGIAGFIHSGKINACANRGNIAGTLHVGGIAGVAYGNVQIADVYNRSTVVGYQCAGGVVGKIEGAGKKARLENCYQEDAFCRIGVVGAASLTDIKNCYYADVEGIGHFTEGTKMAYKEMKSPDFVSQLNQSGTLWKKDVELSVNSGYPILKTITYKGVTTNEATNVTYKSATMNGSILPDVRTAIIRKGFDFWEEKGEQKDTFRVFVLTNPVYYSANDLKPFQKYGFRLVVITSTQTLYGDVHYFQTLPEPHKCGSHCTHPHREKY